MDEIVINVESREIRMAKLKNGKLKDLVYQRKKDCLVAGNIYRGRVTNILKNIKSAFVDIGESDNGFIHISDILDNAQKFQQFFDIDFSFSEEKEDEKLQDDITSFLKEDQVVLVQVVKEPIGSKGARLTSNISLAGRYLVLIPNSRHRGVSKKIEDPAAREKLKKFIQSFDMPKDMGLICRTASMEASAESLINEAHELLNEWESLLKEFQEGKEPTLLFAESDLLKRSVIKAVDQKMHRIVVDDWETCQHLRRVYLSYMKEHSLQIEFYQDKTPLFEKYGIEREIDKALKRKIWLPSGGYLFFDQTEAMYTIDVNSGRSSRENENVEEVLVQINLEAAEEIARQLKIRNVGGLIICDFIDMRNRKNQKRVLERLRECMKEDSARCTILGMSEFGLVEMTRQRNKGSLVHTLMTHCPYCSSLGLIKSAETVSIELERGLKKVVRSSQCHALDVYVHPDLERYIKNSCGTIFADLSKVLKAEISFYTDDRLHLNDFQFYSSVTREKIEV